MAISKSQKALLHVIKAKLAWSDDIYREVLVRVAGVTSSTELDQEGFTAVIGFAEVAGFRPLDNKTPNYGARDGFATFAQLSLIRELWRELHFQKTCDDAHLLAWLKKYHKVDSLRFLTLADVRKVIVTLKAWKARQKVQAA